MDNGQLDLEKLSKSQMVLLTLFVSFMTSIATGIVTVSLMEQAPPAITETVNRVVERTVERVVTGQTAAAAEPVTKTVVVKEADLIPKAVETASPSIVRLYSGDATSSAFLGLGVILDANGQIAVDSSELSGTKEISVELSGSMRVPATFVSGDDSTGISYLSGATSTKDGRVAWNPVQISPQPVLGQTVVLVTGRSAAKVAQGLVTAISHLGDETATEKGILETDLAKDVIMPGSPIIDTSGALIGVSTKTSRTSDESSFVASSLIVPSKSEVKEKKTGN